MCPLTSRLIGIYAVRVIESVHHNCGCRSVRQPDHLEGENQSQKEKIPALAGTNFDSTHSIILHIRKIRPHAQIAWYELHATELLSGL